MGDFFAELRRRHIYRVGAGYVIVAWAIAQVIDLLSQIFALPDWIAQPVVIVLAIGFPVTLVVAWLIEGQAHKAGAPAAASPATKLDWLIAGGLAAVLVFMGYQQFSPNTPEIAATAESEDAAVTIAEEIVEDIADRLPNSIAVLPFENVSPDPDDAYFAVGVHDAILTHLSKLQNVNVIGRTSVLQYPGSGKTIPEIADELNVEMVMEGSVRYAGDQVQVTARLLDGMTNNLMWTEPYDGDLSDIFGIQAEIAMNIANSLRADFSVDEQQRIETPPTDSPEAYDLYLRAIAIIRGDVVGAGEAATRRTVLSLLDEALEFDPEFALAHAWKSDIYGLQKLFDPITEDNWLATGSELDRLALASADMAVALDPNLGFAHAQRAWVHLENWRSGPAQVAAEEALRLSPNDPNVLFLYARIEADIRGNLEEAIQYRERITALDPKNSNRYDGFGQTLIWAGRHSEAVEVLQKCLVLNALDSGCSRKLAMAEFGRGDLDAALDELRRLEVRYGQGRGPGTWVNMIYGYGLLGQPNDARRAFESLENLAADRYVDPVIWAVAHMGVGNYDEAFRLLNIVVENPDLVQIGWWLANIRYNFWSDPVLEQPDWLEMRTRLASIYQ